jgi:hypothetical protein
LVNKQTTGNALGFAFSRDLRAVVSGLTGHIRSDLNGVSGSRTVHAAAGSVTWRGETHVRRIRSKGGGVLDDWVLKFGRVVEGRDAESGRVRAHRHGVASLG